MVLRTLLLVLVLAPSCVHGPRVTRLSRATNVAVAYVVDRDDRREVGDVPEEVAGEIARTLRPRNLRARRVEFASYAQTFESGRTTQHRLGQLATLAPDARLLLLVETKVAFYSQLSGRYRWNVYAKVTMASREALGEAVSAQIDAATFLLFAHEREPRALTAAATEIAERVGRLADDFLGGLAAPRAGAVADVEPYDAIYFVMVDRFANGDPANDGAVDRADPAAFHGGDLQGILSHLDELQELGVRTIWLSPVFATRAEPFMGHGAFHGYWVMDLDAIDPRFGSVELLARLSDELHRRGMRLLLDVVLNHVAFDAPLVTERPQWFHHEGPITDFEDRAQLVDHEVHGLPDLAQERPEVYEYLLARSVAWIDRVRPDGFRLDAVKHVPVEFWSRYNEAVRSHAGPGFVLLGEELDGDPQLLARTMAEGGFSALFDFPLHFAMVDVFCRDMPPGRLAATLSADRAYEAGARLVTLLDNHDLPRIVTACGNDVERVRQALTFLLTARGTPSITYGTEVGLEGQAEPANRGDMRFEDHALAAHIRKLLALRGEHPALRGRSARMLEVGDGLFAYLRAGGGEIALIAVNRGTEPGAVSLPAELGGVVHDAFDGEALPNPVPVAPGSTRVALISSGTLPAPSHEPVEVEFRVRGTPLGTGDALYVVGGGAELGNWNPERGFGPLEASGDELVARRPLPAGLVLEYKLVVRAQSGAATWETGSNRYVLLGQAPQRVDCTWRS
ncbi:MAG: DUF3459 domain-containing protein [Deltaproteobacteria bacterium]|nr:DUF3459 domain-containing protein [Deltaproteobacteria bacterium]